MPYRTLKKPLQSLLNRLEDLEQYGKVVRHIPHRSVKTIEEYKTPPDVLAEYVAPVQDPRDRALIACLFATGLRVGEIISIKRSQVSREEKSVIFKGVQIEKQHGLKLLDKALPLTGPLAPFTETVWAYIQDLKPKQLLFDITRTRVYQIVRKHTGQWPHYFRSQHLSYLANDCQLHTLAIKELSGHASTHSLEVYVHSNWRKYEGRY